MSRREVTGECKCGANTNLWVSIIERTKHDDQVNAGSALDEAILEGKGRQ